MAISTISVLLFACTGGGVYSFFHKRPRPSDGSPPITSGTRFPDAAASSATSSTRTAPSSPQPRCASSAASRDRQVFQEYCFGPPQQSSEQSSEQEQQCDTEARERFEQERAYTHQDHAQRGGLELMAAMAQAAAQAATVQLTAHVEALTLQLQALPAAVARDTPMAVRERSRGAAAQYAKFRLKLAEADCSMPDMCGDWEGAVRNDSQPTYPPCPPAPLAHACSCYGLLS